MPDQEALEAMYGDDYEKFVSSDEVHSGAEGAERVTRELADRDQGNFLDYGCGGGYLLREVSKFGWNCFGLEFNARFNQDTGDSGTMIISDLDQLPPELYFDVIHMGDVIEHLTNVNDEMPKILNRLKPGGLFIAQGPLEANFNLFLSGLRLKRFISHSDSSMPPYHVSLATSEGQRKFFSRFGIDDISFDVMEAAHPAPDRVRVSELSNLRNTALYLLRKFSQAVSPLLSSTAGNRYFYVGKRNG
jgi:SAM-dependent methyltransferase